MKALFICLAITAASESGVAKVATANLETACEQAQHLLDTSYKYDIEPEVLMALIWVESRWNKKAVSRANACGLTQVIPKYSRPRKTCSELKDPETSIVAGAVALNYWITKRNKKKYKEALSCYNAGNKCLNSKYGANYARIVLSKARWYKLKINSYKEK